jgi:DNA polymerase V
MENQNLENRIHSLANFSSTVPFFDMGIPAGFPSPATDHKEHTLDLHELLVEHPTATFFVRVKGDSMKGAHICDGDLLVVDRALTPASGKIIVAFLDGEFTVKRLVHENERWTLVAENPRYAPIQIEEGHDFQVWGIVTYVIHRAR